MSEKETCLNLTGSPDKNQNFALGRN